MVSEIGQILCIFQQISKHTFDMLHGPMYTNTKTVYQPLSTCSISYIISDENPNKNPTKNNFVNNPDYESKITI